MARLVELMVTVEVPPAAGLVTPPILKLDISIVLVSLDTVIFPVVELIK